jgi:hypothetical protein
MIRTSCTMIPNEVVYRLHLTQSLQFDVIEGSIGLGRVGFRSRAKHCQDETVESER